MGKFRKKPVVIDAIQLPPAGVDMSKDDLATLHEILAGNEWASGDDETISILTPEGVMEGRPGDWIIRGVKGEAYPCKPDVFAATYDPVTP